MSNPVPSTQHPGSALGPPSRARYTVVVFAVVVAIIQYIDRVAISQAAPLIRADLGLDQVQMGFVFAAFTLAYAAFEIPTGYWGDRIGAKRILIRVVLWWSFFTAATGWAWNFVSLVIIRFLFGAGEAGCFPNIARAFSRWLPLDERARAQGIPGCSRAGAAPSRRSSWWASCSM
jgi:MFS family permease